MDYSIRQTDVPDEATRAAILDPLIAFNRVAAGRHDLRPLILAIHDTADRVVGGLWGRTAYDYLFVELLFIPESMRGRGLGSELLLRAEREAMARGCHSAWLDTFEFQARGFYERLGYECFGELESYPTGSRFFMTKRLVPNAT